MATPDPDMLMERGRKLFAGPCDFIWAASKIDGLPPLGPAEIAFAGRSNVGKSSLLNALTGRNSLARTSHTPGRTQELNFFALGVKDSEPLRLVDMPGYGYAAVSKEKISNWTRLMHAYLQGRSALMRVFVLVDGRHGLKPPDHEMFDLLDTTAMPYQIILTKKDEVKKGDIEAVLESVHKGIIKRPAAHPEIVFTSSKTGEGIAELRASIVQLLIERGVDP